ncbi:hypothetical protein CTI12_AA163500 [Artemisia annua]|uniref:Uncharacterized protein n=1 Tax=Artemisia annua TaxID=35608 RepID=A0A2U1PDM0_ARTAN|nr:hypothetical protein CTI12_AA163500 [Artemisia annua]
MWSTLGSAAPTVFMDELSEKKYKETRLNTMLVNQIINRANENQEDPLVFIARFCKEFMIDTTTNLSVIASN